MWNQAKTATQPTLLPSFPSLTQRLQSPTAIVAGTLIVGLGIGGLMSYPALSQQKAKDVQITLVSYAVTRAAYDKIIPKFVAKWQKEKNQTVTFKQSYGGSGSQTRAVLDGLEADVVQLALASDVDKIQKGGLINAGWQKEVPNNGIVTKLESAKFSVRHFDKMPKSLALKAFQRL